MVAWWFLSDQVFFEDENNHPVVRSILKANVGLFTRLITMVLTHSHVNT